jgi:hypothetical protein
MRRYHHHCGEGLRLWETRCPYCNRSALSWLYVLIVTASAAMGIFCFFKFY